jgi:hypothetical protein
MEVAARRSGECLCCRLEEFMSRSSSARLGSSSKGRASGGPEIAGDVQGRDPRALEQDRRQDMHEQAVELLCSCAGTHALISFITRARSSAAIQSM